MKFFELHFCFILILFFNQTNLNAQFAGAVGTANTTAIFKDSNIFVNWAKSCIIERGLKDISIDSLGFADLGTDTNAIGNAGNAVVSLGDGGKAIAIFNPPIKNLQGFDFAVFENSFSDLFLELAFVEVSSDGINFYRFPATSNVQTQQQIGPFDLLGEADKINNLAGKYRALYGTPFDLEELTGVTGLNTNAITHIKLIDVVGVINGPFVNFDQNQHAINDPYPTPFSSSGFDLDAIGVIHQQDVGLKNTINQPQVSIYPNPAEHEIFVYSNNEIIEIKLFNLNGNCLVKTNISKLNISNLEKGIYFICVEFKNGFSNYAKFLKN